MKLELSVLLISLACIQGLPDVTVSHSVNTRNLGLAEHLRGRPPLNVITVATNINDDGFKAFNESLQLASRVERPMKLTVVQRTYEEFWGLGWRSKILSVVPVLRELPADEIVVLSDSNDVIFLPCGRDVLTDFRRLDADIALNLMWFQYPDRFKEALFPQQQDLMDPETPFATDEEKEGYKKNRYLNAGVIMGRVEALLYYMAGIFVEHGYIDKGDFDDQTFWTNMYLAQFKGRHSSRGRHNSPPKIVVDSGALVSTMESHMPLDQIGNTGYYKSNATRYSCCIAHAAGGDVNRIPLRNRYYNTWRKPWLKQDRADSS